MDRTWLRLLALFALGTFSCSDDGADIATSILRTSWQLESIQSGTGTTVVPSGQVYTLNFVSDSLASGQVHCNTYLVSYQLQNSGNLAFGPFNTTKIYCPRPSLEDEYRLAFDNANSLDFDRSYLRLHYLNQTKVLVFHRSQ
jgi:heat shock protein HslJ